MGTYQISFDLDLKAPKKSKAGKNKRTLNMQFPSCLCLCVKTSLRSKPFPLQVFSHANQTRIYMEGSAQRLVLKQRQKLYRVSIFAQTFQQIKDSHGSRSSRVASANVDGMKREKGKGKINLSLSGSNRKCL